MQIKSLNTFYLSSFLKAQILLLPVLYLFYLDNGLKLSDYFFIQGLIVIINVILQIPVGLLGNYIPRKYLIVTSYMMYLGRIALWLCAKGYLIVLIGEIFYAISKAIFDAVEAPYIYDVLQKEKKEHEMLGNYSGLNVAMSIGTGIASILGAYLYNLYHNYKILLSAEFIVMSSAIALAFFIPKVALNLKSKYSLKEIKLAGAYIFKTKEFIIPILYSALFASFTHFFFWSFQPLMKMALVPVALFGCVVFFNNIIRALGSFYTSFISRFITFKNHGLLILGFDFLAFAVFYFFREICKNNIACLVYIAFLCVCIALQLSFSIRQGSYLQNKSPDKLRGYIAGINMFFMRSFIGIILILPKYIQSNLSIDFIYCVYFLAFIVINLILTPKFCKLFK